MRARQRWEGVPPAARWSAAYAVALALSTLLALTPGWGGDLAFVAGALAILASVGLIGTGSERRFRFARDLFGRPVAAETKDPEERRAQISTGVKLFLLGLALWAPLAYLAWR